VISKIKTEKEPTNQPNQPNQPEMAVDRFIRETRLSCSRGIEPIEWLENIKPNINSS
jgi:hypothetical protein